MRIKVIHLVGVDLRIAQSVDHGAAWAIPIRGGHVTGIGTAAIAYQFGINARATGLGELVFFKHHHPCAFAQHKTITVAVPGARGALRVVIAGRQRSHGSKAAQTQRRNGGLSPTCHHHIRIPIFDDSPSLANAVQTGGASGGDSQIGAFEAATHGDMARNHIDDGSRYKKR